MPHQTLQQRIESAILHGKTNDLEKNLNKFRAAHCAGDLLEITVTAAKTLESQFLSHAVFPSQVIRSAQVIAIILKYLSRFLSADVIESRMRSKICLTTVDGETHEVGKTIVNAILNALCYTTSDAGNDRSCRSILAHIKKHKVDIVGLSAMLYPSLHEITKIARALDKHKFTIPLLLGGPATSAIYTATHVAPYYSAPVIQAHDVRNAVEICQKLTVPELRGEWYQNIKDHQNQIRDQHNQTMSARRLVSLKKARENKFSPDWKNTSLTTPQFTGARIFRNYDLRVIEPYIDWWPLFLSWDLKGKYPGILKDAKMGSEARRVFDDARDLLQEIIQKKLLTVNAVVGFYPATSVRDDILLFPNPKSSQVLSVFPTLRQQMENPENVYHALADFVIPDGHKTKDHVGCFAVTSGIGLKKIVENFEKRGDFYRGIMARILADRLAEALTELIHEHVRREWWGYAANEQLSRQDLFYGRFQGIRPAPGYAACPDHTQKDSLFDLLNVTRRTGIRLTKTKAMDPAASVCGYYFAHPQAHYFALGKIDRVQTRDYARRKGMSIKETEYWLAPNLAYRPSY